MQVYILEKLSIVLSFFEATSQDWPHLQQLKLADPNFLTCRSVNIILGTGAYEQIIKSNFIKHSLSMLIAQQSIFRWLILGAITTTQSISAVAHYTLKQEEDNSLQSLLIKI